MVGFAAGAIRNDHSAIVQIQRKTIVRTAQDVLRYSTSTSQSETPRITIGDRSLELVYRASVDKLNEYLRLDLGENAVDTAPAFGADFNPEDTAGRLVAQSTALFSDFQEQYADEGDNVVRERFMETLRNGLAAGFDEARGVLNRMEALSGDAAANIDRAEALVNVGLAGFERKLGA